MRGNRVRMLCVPALTIALIPGCHTAGAKRPATVVSPAPAVSSTDDAGADRTITAAPAQTVGFADRHPLFSKPREYWDNSGDKKIVKAAAATFIGVPAGVVGEVKQIIVGTPAAPRY